MTKHELKLLNASVILYILAGGLIFHSLGEFDSEFEFEFEFEPELEPELGPSPDGPELTFGGQPSPSSSPSSAAATTEATDKRAAARGQAGPLVAAGQLRELRLRSVQRMWNITNQLNILYESNWTELVLAELVDFERRLIGALESGEAGAELKRDEQQQAAAQEGSEHESDRKQGQERKEEVQEDEEGQEGEKRRRAAAKQRAREAEARRSKAKQEARLKSLKRALVHSLATITATGKSTLAIIQLVWLPFNCNALLLRARFRASG